jgi:hypothetical protein
LRHLEVHVALDDFKQCDVRRAQIGAIGQHRPGLTPTLGIQLSDAPGNQVDQDVAIRDDG